MPPSSPPRVALATVVTERALREFLILRRSFTLCHGPGYRWFVRCDAASHAALAGLPDVHAVVCEPHFSSVVPRRSEEPWLALMVEKKNAMEDAWAAAEWDAVAHIDTDVIVTRPFIERALMLGGQVVLTPHRFSGVRAGDARIYGYYNTGFVMARDRAFPAWWRDAARRHKSDQRCMDDAHDTFDVRELPQEANVGWWRGGDLRDVAAVPGDCLFFHAHLFQPPTQAFEFAQRAFVLNALQSLLESGEPDHRLLAREIVAEDDTGFYRALLCRRIAVLTRCEPRRAVRLQLMAQTLPRQIDVLCACDGPPDAFAARLGGAALPDNVHLFSAAPAWGGRAVERADWLAHASHRVELAFPVDIDFVFPIDFWHRLWEARQAALALETAAGDHAASGIEAGGIGAAAFGDPDGRYLWYQFWRRHHGIGAAARHEPDGRCPRGPVHADLLDEETSDTHSLPLDAGDVACADALSMPSSSPAGDGGAGPVAHLMPCGGGAPGVLMDAEAFGRHGRPAGGVRVVPDTFLFHLWHPADQESPHAVWHAASQAERVERPLL